MELILALLIMFSIHASAKEATNQSVVQIVYTVFQSTPPRRRRPKFVTILEVHHFVFNPRLREGGDKLTLICSQTRLFSIHASAKEATEEGWQASLEGRFFNPRLREGGDPVGCNWFVCDKSFQSTPPRRRRLFSLF